MHIMISCIRSMLWRIYPEYMNEGLPSGCAGGASERWSKDEASLLVDLFTVQVIRTCRAGSCPSAITNME